MDLSNRTDMRKLCFNWREKFYQNRGEDLSPSFELTRVEMTAGVEGTRK